MPLMNISEEAYTALYTLIFACQFSPHHTTNRLKGYTPAPDWQIYSAVLVYSQITRKLPVNCYS